MEQKTAEEILHRGNTVEYWKNNAEENYSITPISVLKYITVLEEIMQSYADQEVSKAIDKALEMASSEVEFIVCATTYERIGKDLILSLKPEILKELEK